MQDIKVFRNGTMDLKLISEGQASKICLFLRLKDNELIAARNVQFDGNNCYWDCADYFGSIANHITLPKDRKQATIKKYLVEADVYLKEIIEADTEEEAREKMRGKIQSDYDEFEWNIDAYEQWDG